MCGLGADDLSVAGAAPEAANSQRSRRGGIAGATAHCTARTGGAPAAAAVVLVAGLGRQPGPGAPGQGKPARGVNRDVQIAEQVF